MSKGEKGTFQPDTDVHITLEDQQRINKFARCNAWMDDAKEELKTKQNVKKALEDAVDDIQLLDEDEDVVPYQVGEAFIELAAPEAIKTVENMTEKMNKDILELEKKIAKVKENMSELKVMLYGRFGSNINLENEEE